ncbi:MAG TPA: hypothetical protein VGN76_08035 [Gemmatimonadales bacterium]|nr:hypothetical protein [Gemmatimonadales bacterium]
MYELDRTIDQNTAARAVEKVLRFHQQALSGITCPTHQETPWLKVSGGSVRDLAVSVESCCPALSEKVEARIEGISRRND